MINTWYRLFLLTKMMMGTKMVDVFLDFVVLCVFMYICVDI